MNLDALKDTDCDALIREVDMRYAPIFNRTKYSDDENRAIYRYLFSRRPKKTPPSMKTRLINLYDPMADRSKRFPDGLRWCLNVYVGCEHNCGYCYVNGYSKESVGISPHIKANFERTLIKDIQALKDLGVPAVPLHMSNSTDPLQEYLETRNRHALVSLQKILDNRERFSSVVILTKNPGMLCSNPYLSIIKDPGIRPLTVQVTCPYWRDEARLFYEPKAPPVKNRLEAIEFLSENGIDVDLRIDPLFPSSRIPKDIRKHDALPRYMIPEVQTHEDIVNLAHFSKKAKVKAIIVNQLKVPFSNSAQLCKDWFADLYRDANPGGNRTTRAGSWRLPDLYQKALISTVADICHQENIPCRHCMQDVLSRV